MKTLHVQVDDNIRRLAAIRASELRKSISQYVGDLVRQDAEHAGLDTYLAGRSRQTREEACNGRSAELLAQLAPAARAVLEGSPIENDKARIRQLLGLDGTRQANALRRHLVIGMPWEHCFEALPGPTPPPDPLPPDATGDSTSQVIAPSEAESGDTGVTTPDTDLGDEPIGDPADEHVDHHESLDPTDVGIDGNPFETSEGEEIDDKPIDPPDAIRAELAEADPEPGPDYLPARWRLDAIKPNKFNARLFPDSLSDEALAPLVEDIRRWGQLEPVTIYPDGTLENGERRCRALGLLGRDMVDVRIVPRKSDPELLAAVVSNAATTRQLTVRHRVNIYTTVQQELKEQAGRLPGRPSKKPSSNDEHYLTPEQIDQTAARDAGLGSVSTAERAAAVFTRASPDVQQKVLDGKLSIAGAFKQTPKLVNRQASRSSETNGPERPTTNGATTDQADASETEGGAVKDDTDTEGNGRTMEAALASVQGQEAQGADDYVDEDEPSQVIDDEDTEDDPDESDDATEEHEEPEDEDEEPEGNEDDEEPLAFSELMEPACERIQQTRRGHRGDGLTHRARYELARADVDEGIERLRMALGEDPDDDDDNEPEESQDDEFADLIL